VFSQTTVSEVLLELKIGNGYIVVELKCHSKKLQHKKPTPKNEQPVEANNLTRFAILALLLLASVSIAEANPSSVNPTKSAPTSIKSSTKPTSVRATKATLSPQDLQFGEQQVQKLLIDRPRLAKVLLKNEPIWPWVVRQFAGEAAGQRIYWNSSALNDKDFDYDADHSAPEPGEPGYIRLRKTDKYGQPMAAERLLAALVFECYNINNSPAFDRVYQAALKGNLSQDQYIEQNAQIEFEAGRKTATFYHTIFEPLARKRHYNTAPLYWEAESPATYAAWRAQYTDRTGYPWSFWGKYYDESIVPYLKAVKKYKATQKH